MTGRIIQVNISPGGIPKRPVAEAFLTPLGLEGDACAHPVIHGGPRQAVLVLCAEVVDELAAKGYAVFYGALGENLTVAGLDPRRFRSGQRYQAGEAIVEVTRLRRPCRTIAVYGAGIEQELFDRAASEGDPRSPKWGYGGVYASVVRAGWIRPGDPFVLLEELA
jgi:MOSC domain-containing protein YiiM